ncbi:MAG: hypothetical protein QNJ62_12085 [Methyloceanibacter sp.]|nr:hypothetical protein [Methyloceanibacter sp.]
MAIKLNQEALADYIEQVLDAFKDGKVSKDKAIAELVWIVTEAGIDNTSEIEARLMDVRERFGIS